MVYVLPEPVCPYARIVALKPLSTRSTCGAPTVSYTSSCEQPASNARSIANSNCRAVTWPGLSSGAFTSSDVPRMRA